MTTQEQGSGSGRLPAGGIVGVFDRVADTYDAVGVDWFGPIAAGLVQALDPQPGEHALDIGCGKGAALIPIARAIGPAGRVTGIDLAPRMVDAARRAAADAGLGNVETQVDDASAPGLEKGAYDVAVSSLVLFFLRDPAAVMTGWTSLLRPGGRLGTATFGPIDPVWNEVDAVFTPYLPPQMHDARTTGQRGPFASDSAMEDLFREAGLDDVRTETTTVEAVLQDPDHWYRFSWSHGQRAMWECVPEDDREQVRDDAYAVLETARRPDGSIVFSQRIRYTLGSRPA